MAIDNELLARMSRRNVVDDDDDDDDDSASTSSSSSSSSRAFSDDQSESIVQQRRKSGFASMMHDWMGDEERSVLSGVSEEPPLASEGMATAPSMRPRKKKLVPVALKPSFEAEEEEERQQRCYLVTGTRTQESLAEHYSSAPVVSFLAYWTPPADKEIPPFKFTQNWGKSELINSAQGDLRGKVAYFSGICQWLRVAKTFDAKIKFCNHVAGWECDLYFYFLEPQGGGAQTVLAEDGEEFSLGGVDGVAIISRGRDFLHHDPRFQCGIDKWVSEGSKLGFAARLDVTTGSAYPSNAKKRRSTLFGARKGQPLVQEEEEEEEEKEGKPESRMTVGAPVYVRDPHYSWIPATIESEEDDKRRVKVEVRLPRDWEDQTVKASGRGAQNMKMERLVKLSDYGNDELPLQNLERDGVTAMGKDDMADLTNLHEAAILYNLKARHAQSLPYTRVGDILVAVNPFRWIDGLYAREKQEFYAANLIWATTEPGMDDRRLTSMKANPLATAAMEKKALGYDYEKLGINPHVYETSSLAYLGLAMERSNQTILVTGESGAGKTETIKIVMNHLATVEKSRPNWPESDRECLGGCEEEFGTVDQVLQANPLFEAFGNAKTLRNDNSSRFGKFTQLQFDVETFADAKVGGRAVPSCHLSGSQCVTYLLEKSRVVGASEGERTFHIFYQMLGAPEGEKSEIWEGLAGDTGVADFAYLSSTSAIDGLAGPENWPDTVAALSVFGIKGESYLNVMRSLCVILQLGNISFEVEMQGGEERGMISTRDELEKLSGLIGLPAMEIEDALTKRVIRTRGEEFTVFSKESEARDGRDALAKEIYARIFDLLVTACNESTEPAKSFPTNEYGTISLLDIFGFESFKVNKFEQLCINYCNERLQQKYVLDNFEAIKSEYEEEGVNVFDFSLVDNSEVMQLLEGKLGLITQLNEECVRKNGSDESFVYKFKVVNSDSNRMIQDHLHRPYEFGIKHYAAPIKYDARMFIERNLDKIPNDLLKCAMTSSNPLIREEFHQLFEKQMTPKSGGPKKRSEATKHLVVTKFKQQLTSLMSLIENSRTRYIRCVKPNKTMAPAMMDHAHTVSQLESAGLVTAIVISRESFPNRLSYEMIMERFRFLVYKFPDCHFVGDIQADSEMLISYLLAGVMHDSHKGRVEAFSCGKTSIYFRTGALERIETIRQDYYAERAIQLGAWYRMLVARRRFLTLKRGMVLLQCEARRWLARKAFMRKVRIAVMMQGLIRRYLAKEELLSRRKNHAATVIQTRWRGIKPQRKFKTIRKAAVRMQCFIRLILSKKEAVLKKKERDEHNNMNNRMNVIQQTFDDATTIQGTVFSVDEGLLDEVETMFEFLRKEIIVLRKKNAKLKKDLAEAETDKREIFNHASSVDHAFSLSKIRNEQMSKTNMALLDDNNKRRKEANNLKNELKTQQQAHEIQLREMRAEFELAMRNREIELNTMQQTLHSSTSLHKREVQAVRDEAERKQEEQHSQISRLREEIKNTQESHQHYLSKLMGVLETTQESRRNLNVPSGDVVMRRKDDEIAELRDEVAKLTNQAEDEEDAANRKEATRAMKYIVKKNREHRKAHVQNLVKLTSQLEETIASGDMPQMQQLLNLMKEAIHTGEKSNSKMDRETVNMIDNSALYSQGGVANANAALVADNQRLRRKLEKCGQKRDHRKIFKSEGETSSVIDRPERPGLGDSESVTSSGKQGSGSIARQGATRKLGKAIGVRSMDRKHL